MDVISNTWQIICLLDIVIHILGAPHNTENTNVDVHGKCFQNTYYISDYHVHGSNSNMFLNESGKPPPGVPHRKNIQFEDVTKEEFLKEKRSLLNKNEELAKELLSEKQKRIQQLGEFSQWINSISVSQNGKLTIPKFINDAIDEKLSSILKQKGEEAKESVTHGVQSDGATSAARSREEGEALKLWRTRRTGIFNENDTKDKDNIRNTKTPSGEIDAIIKSQRVLDERYVYLYKHFKRLGSSHRQLQKEYLRNSQRRKRRDIFVEMEIQNLKWDLGNQTRRWNMLIAELGFEVDSQGRLSSKHERNPRPVERPVDTSQGVQAVGVPDGKMLQDAIIEAGRQVTDMYWGKIRSERPRDCSEIDTWIQRENKIQVIYLYNRTFPVKVLCEEGWTHLMSNKQGMHEKGSETWESCKHGHGSLDKRQFWIGLEYMYIFTKQDDYQLQIDMKSATDFSDIRAVYAYFSVKSEREWYKLQVDDYAGKHQHEDIMGVYSSSSLNDAQFSSTSKAKDDDHLYLAKANRAGWWYPDKLLDDSQACYTHLSSQAPRICKAGRVIPLAQVTMKIKPANKILG